MIYSSSPKEFGKIYNYIYYIVKNCTCQFQSQNSDKITGGRVPFQVPIFVIFAALAPIPVFRKILSCNRKK